MASDTVYVGQLICDSTTPPPDRGFYKINDTTTGHVGKLVMSDPVSGKESVALTATLSDGGVVFDSATTAAIQKTAAAASPLVPSGLLAGVSDGFALDTTVSDKRRAVQIASGDVVSYSAVEDMFPTDCITAKMVEQPDGSLKWSEHNLFACSDDLTAASWTKTGVTPTAGASYIGDASASTLAATATATAAYIGQVAPSAAQFPYRSIQAICKAGTANIAFIEFFDIAARRAYFDLAAGTVGTTDAGVTATINTTDSSGVALPAGYYRITSTYRCGVTAPTARIGLADANGSTAVTAGKTLIVERPHMHYGMRPLTYLRNSGTTAKYAPVYHEQYGMLLELAHWVTNKWADDLSNAVWTKTSVSAALTATGPDSEPCTTLTATADGGTITQPTTDTAANQTFSAYIKRRSGTGAIYMTANGGATWVDVTAKISASKYTRVIVHGNASPTIGFKLGTSGDAIDISKAMNVTKPFVTAPLATYSAITVVLATTLNIPKLRMPYSGELTMFVEWHRGDETSALETSYPFSLKDDLGAQYTRLGIDTVGRLLFGNLAGGTGTNHAFYRADTPNAPVACTISVATARQCVSINGDPTMVVDNTNLPAWTSLAFRQAGVNDTSSMYVKRVLVVPGAIDADEVRTWRWSGTHPYIIDSRIVNPVRAVDRTTWQREPSLAVLNDNGSWADFAVLHMQKHVTGHMGEAPARIVQRNYRFVKSTGKLTALTDSAVIATPDRFYEGLGHMQSASMARIPVGPDAGKWLVLYTKLDSPQGTFTPDARNVYMQIGDGTPTGWGAPRMIVEAASLSMPYVVLAPGQEIIVLPPTHAVAPNRMIVLGYISNGCYGIYSDDGAQTWTLGNLYTNPTYTTDEPTLTLGADGSLIATHRTRTDLVRTWSISTDGGVTFVDQGVLNGDLEYKCGAGATQLDPTGAVSKRGVLALSRPTTSTRYGLRISKASGPDLKTYSHIYPWSQDRASGYSALAAIFGGTHLILASEAGVGGDRYSEQVYVIKI